MIIGFGNHAPNCFIYRITYDWNAIVFAYSLSSCFHENQWCVFHYIISLHLRNKSTHNCGYEVLRTPCANVFGVTLTWRSWPYNLQRFILCYLFLCRVEEHSLCPTHTGVSEVVAFYFLLVFSPQKTTVLFPPPPPPSLSYLFYGWQLLVEWLELCFKMTHTWPLLYRFTATTIVTQTYTSISKSYTNV